MPDEGVHSDATEVSRFGFDSGLRDHNIIKTPSRFLKSLLSGPRLIQHQQPVFRP
jgi:hypothetical protein